MKFLCIGYFDAKKMGARPKDEIDALMARCRPHLDKLYSTGQVICDIGVSNDKKSLQRVNGVLTTTTNAVSAHGEMIGGAFLIEARDTDDAVRVASMHPATQILEGEQLGWRIEIRPAYYFKSIGEISK